MVSWVTCIWVSPTTGGGLVPDMRGDGPVIPVSVIWLAIVCSTCRPAATVDERRPDAHAPSSLAPTSHRCGATDAHGLDRGCAHRVRLFPRLRGPSRVPGRAPGAWATVATMVTKMAGWGNGPLHKHPIR